MKKLSPFRFITLALSCAVLAVSTVIALGVSGTTARHEPHTVPIKAHFGTTGQLEPTDTPGVFHNSIIGVGNIPRLGICTIVIDESPDLRTDPGTATQSWVLTFVAGDELTATLNATGSFDQTDPAFIQGDLEGVITGGTGRFHDATGRVRGLFVGHLDTPPGAFPAELHGTIALEGFVRLAR